MYEIGKFIFWIIEIAKLGVIHILIVKEYRERISYNLAMVIWYHTIIDHMCIYTYSPWYLLHLQNVFHFY